MKLYSVKPLTLSNVRELSLLALWVECTELRHRIQSILREMVSEDEASI